MSYYYRSSRKKKYHPRRKGPAEYILPLIIIASFFLGVVLLFQSLQKENNQGNFLPKTAEKGKLKIHKGEIKILLRGNERWQNAKDKIEAYEGDSLKTSINSLGELAYEDGLFQGLRMVLAQNTIAEIQKIEITEEDSKIFFFLRKGEIFVDLENMEGEGKVFVSTKNVENLVLNGLADIQQQGSEEVVRVIKGRTTAKVMGKSEDESKEIAEFSIGVSQKLTISPKVMEIISVKEDYDPIQGISEKFRKSNWFRWNEKIKLGEALSGEDKSSQENDDYLSVDEEGSDPEDGSDGEESNDENLDTEEGENKAKISITFPKEKHMTNKDTIKVEGNFNPNEIKKIFVGEIKTKLDTKSKTWKASRVALITEGENLIPVSYEDKDGKDHKFATLKVFLDKTAPQMPTVISPEKNSKITETLQVIKGEVSSDTDKIKVNNYFLQEYQSGSKKWKYIASTKWGNLKEGENTYTVSAFDKAGNESEVLEFTLIYEGKVEEENEKDENSSSVVTDVAPDDKEKEDDNKVTEETEDTSPQKAPTITTNEGKTIATTENKVLIEGTCDKRAVKVVVNGYVLGKFKKDGTWSYFAAVEYDTLTPGKNIYEIYSVDKLGRKSPTTTFIIIKR